MITMGARFNAQGQYTWVGSVEAHSKGDDLYIGYVDPHTQYHDTGAGVPVDMPTKPSDAHEFDYVAHAWVLNADRAWLAVRIKRDRMLKDTDWLVTKAMETGTAVPAPWAAYRQDLRDITEQADPVAVAWPATPGAA